VLASRERAKSLGDLFSAGLASCWQSPSSLSAWSQEGVVQQYLLYWPSLLQAAAAERPLLL
jgi:hypothetical protein